MCTIPFQPSRPRDWLQAAWQQAVFALYLAEDRIAPEVVETNKQIFAHRPQKHGERRGIYG
jgi:hypothetical protein